MLRVRLLRCQGQHDEGRGVGANGSPPPCRGRVWHNSHSQAIMRDSLRCSLRVLGRQTTRWPQCLMRRCTPYRPVWDMVMSERHCCATTAEDRLEAVFMQKLDQLDSSGCAAFRRSPRQATVRVPLQQFSLVMLPDQAWRSWAAAWPQWRGTLRRLARSRSGRRLAR